MPSSFSPSLRIELIAPGEQAGTWGTTTNTNLGTLMEDAIAGVETVSVTTADQALTYADGAADQARNAVLQLTTTTGAPFAIYAPPDPKQYTIYNASAHEATVFNSTVDGNTTAAGTGVTIPAGETMTIWSNGTNFRVQNSRIEGSITGNAATATALQTARTIGGVSFDGTADINLPGVNAPGNQNTTGNAATATTAGNAIGVGQTWQSPSRAINTTYTNTTGRSIFVFVSANHFAPADAFTSASMVINGIGYEISRLGENDALVRLVGGAGFVIPAGATYRLSSFVEDGGVVSLSSWAELR
jgi:hypothetical protein